MGVRRIRKTRIGMNYTTKTKVIASEFVIKCFMAGVFVLFMIVTIPLFSESIFLATIIQMCLLIGSVRFVRSLLWDVFGKEELTITEQELIIDRILLLSKKSIVVPLEDITSIECTQYIKKADNGIFINSISFWRYLASITTLDKGYITIQTPYRSYRFGMDVHQRESIIDGIKARRHPVID